MTNEIDAIKTMQEIVCKGITGALINGDLEVSDEMVTSYLATVIHYNYEWDFLKTIGLLHYKNNQEAQKIIYDFIGFLNDLSDKGVEYLEK